MLLWSGNFVLYGWQETGLWQTDLIERVGIDGMQNMGRTEGR